MEDVRKYLLSKNKPEINKRVIGLMLPGGGMTGVFGGGVMQVLEKLGLSEAFDYIYSGSSGSCSGAYLLSGKTKLGSSIYSEDLSGNIFLNFRLKGNIMDLDYFCDDVMQKKALDIEKIKKSKTVIKIFLTDAHTGEMTYLTNKDPVDFMSLIKASCTYPGLYRPLVRINDKEYLDGTVMNLFPIEEAILDKCTDIITVATYPKEYRFSKYELFGIISRLFLKGVGKNYKNKYKNQIENINNSLDLMFGVKSIEGSPNIYVIAPDYHISPSETNKKNLKAFEKHGIEKAKEFFDIKTQQ